MDNIPGKGSLPRLTSLEIEDFNRSVPSEEIEKSVKVLPHKELSGPDGFTGEFF